ncbi:ATP-grasp domain-containing protein [Lapidilactobacillus bayanensis]|uniref:ATP-grasp domain-containing protein n=1 Tax=Lapidilactobacillus bayanensis TaxID=2485998 RepID=UPI000F78B67E|nr:ATP-grasp domain-containing protein [Lapidilactobacillus bayanensis]
MSFVYPRSYIGIIGGGQSGWQLANAAHKLGFLVNMLLANPHDLAARAADRVLVGSCNDVDLLQQLAAASKTVIYTNEEVSVNAINEAQIADKIPQGTELLAITQDRYLEKAFLEDHNIIIPPYAMVVSLDDIRSVIDSIGYPSVLKPIQKGLTNQAYYLLEKPEDLNHFENGLPDGSYILESWVAGTKEYAIMVGKDQNQKIQTFPILETVYHNGDFHSALAHQKNDPELMTEIQRVANEIAQNIHYQGLMSVTFFETQAGLLFVKGIYPGTNEAADIYGSVTGFSQYEIQLRAICDWPVPDLYLRQEGALIALATSVEPQVFAEIQRRVNWHFTFWPQLQTSGRHQPTLGEAVVVASDYQSLLELLGGTELW